MDLDAVTWLVDEPTDGPLLRLQWRETSGAPCEKSEKRGFGSVLIERSVARELGDHASLILLPNSFLVYSRSRSGLT